MLPAASREAYDDAGRLTKETDEVRSSRHIDYVYDNAGRTVTMNDWAGQDTVYAYTDVGAVSTVTGPGSMEVAFASRLGGFA